MSSDPAVTVRLARPFHSIMVLLKKRKFVLGSALIWWNSEGSGIVCRIVDHNIASYTIIKSFSLDFPLLLDWSQIFIWWDTW